MIDLDVAKDDLKSVLSESPSNFIHPFIEYNFSVGVTKKPPGIDIPS